MEEATLKHRAEQEKLRNEMKLVKTQKQEVINLNENLTRNVTKLSEDLLKRPNPVQLATYFADNKV
jgi:hypothetical protein